MSEPIERLRADFFKLVEAETVLAAQENTKTIYALQERLRAEDKDNKLLRDEVERLREEVAERAEFRANWLPNTIKIDKLTAENERLKAENESLLDEIKKLRILVLHDELRKVDDE